jgi:hypothetical protein
MYVDWAQYDGALEIVSDRRRGLYAYSLRLKDDSRKMKAAGQLPAESTSHQLLLVAVVNALASIPKSTISHRLEGTGRDKMRILLSSQDEEFLAGIDHITKHGIRGTKLRNRKGFHAALSNQLARFEIQTHTPDAEDRAIGFLHQFAKRTIKPDNAYTALPAHMVPVSAEATYNR